MNKQPRREHRHLIRYSNDVGFNKRYTTIAIYAIFVLIVGMICVYFLLNTEQYVSIFDTIKGIILPIFIGMMIAYILNPFLNFFEKQVFLSKTQRALLKARRGLFNAKLAYDQQRKQEAPSSEEIDRALERLQNAQVSLSAAYQAEEDAQAQKTRKLRKKNQKKKSRPSFFPQPEKDRSHPMRGISLLCTYIVFFAIISLVLWIVIPQCIQSITGFIGNLTTYVQKLPELLQTLLHKYSFIETAYNFVSEHVDIQEQVLKFVETTSGKLTKLLSALPNYAITFFSSLASGVTNFILSIFFSVYFLSSKEMLGAQITRLGRAFLNPRAYMHTRHVIGEIDRKFGKFIEGKILDSTIIGCLALVATAFMQMPYYQMLSLIIGITNVIPFFGPIFGGIIGGAIVLISEPSKLIPFLIMVLILQQLDGNVIGPYILGDSLGLAPIWIMIAIVVMSGLFDFFGMLFGVPLFAVIYTLVQESIERKFKKRKRKIAALAAALAAEAEAEAAEAAGTAASDGEGENV